MRKTTLLIILSLCMVLVACKDQKSGKQSKKDSPVLVKKKRADGTLQSVAQIDGQNYAHGVKVSYYDDGKTVRSKSSWVHGSKNGAAAVYYKNGQLFEHCSFQDGSRHGVSKKYFKTGELLSSCTYEHGKVLPGLIEYSETGEKISYADITIREIDKLAWENKFILRIDANCSNRKVEIFRESTSSGVKLKTPLEVKKGVAEDVFTVAQGDILMQSVNYVVEVNTNLGNTLVRIVNHKVAASNR